LTIATIFVIFCSMDGRKKTIALNETEYGKLELARIKYENSMKRRATAFGEVVLFLSERYLNEGKEQDAEKGR